MKPIPLTALTAEVARRIVWFEEPEKALSDPIRFMAYAMTYARHEDMQVIRQYVSDDEFREALDHAPPGIMDARSWAYWNLKMGRFPPPPLPQRSFDEGVAVNSTSRLSPQEQTHAAAQAWLKIRGQEPTVPLEELQRRAVQAWSEKYGPGKKK